MADAKSDEEKRAVARDALDRYISSAHDITFDMATDQPLFEAIEIDPEGLMAHFKGQVAHGHKVAFKHDTWLPIIEQVVAQAAGIRFK